MGINKNRELAVDFDESLLDAHKSAISDFIQQHRMGQWERHCKLVSLDFHPEVNFLQELDALEDELFQFGHVCLDMHAGQPSLFFEELRRQKNRISRLLKKAQGYEPGYWRTQVVRDYLSNWSISLSVIKSILKIEKHEASFESVCIATSLLFSVTKQFKDWVETKAMEEEKGLENRSHGPGGYRFVNSAH